MTDTITVVGNIASNPDHRTAGAVPVTSFRVATSERRPDAQGAWVDAHTNYYTVSAFRGLGDNAFASLRRGDRVIVSGRLRLKEWTASDGTKGRTIEIDADAVGHDLRFGTTVFQRGARGEAGPGDPVPSAEWSTAPVVDAWSAPDDEERADAEGDGAEPMALVGAGAGDDVDADTPRVDRRFALVSAEPPF